MAEYIKFEPLRDEILNDPDYDNDTINHFLDVIDSQPTADVVEVVRCSKCQHGRSCVDKDEVVACLLESEWDDDLGIDYGFVTYHSNNHYCSYGERKEGE